MNRTVILLGAGWSTMRRWVPCTLMASSWEAPSTQSLTMIFPLHPEKCRLSAQEELVRREPGRGAIFKLLNMIFSLNWETTPMPCM